MCALKASLGDILAAKKFEYMGKARTEAIRDAKAMPELVLGAVYEDADERALVVEDDNISVQRRIMNCRAW